jgi:branched-subunit amino acid transport protein AzlD
MTPEVAVVGFYRILGSLVVLRWPFAGALIAIGVDLTDLLLFNLLDLGGVPDYQSFDKWADQVYLLAFLIVALRDFRPLEKRIAVGLYLFRLVGFIAFEAGAPREMLFVFPNLFEFWFVAVVVVARLRPAFTWTPARAAAVLAALLVAKLAQEWALHIAKLFDSFTFLDALRAIWHAVTGG